MRSGSGFSFDGAEGGAGLADAFDAFDSPVGCLAGALLAILFGVLVAFLLPLVFTVIELFIAVVLIPLAIAMRVFLRSPWILVARTSGPPREIRTQSVAGWQASRRAIDDLANEIRSAASVGVAHGFRRE